MKAELVEAIPGITPYVSLIGPDGHRDSVGAFAELVADVGPAELLALYRDMVIIRRIDTEATALQRQGELGLWPPLLGQEAAQIGSARALAPDDFVFSSYRENGVAWVRGVAPTDLLVTWRGVAQSGWDPFIHRMATPQVIIGAQTLHATGYALGMQLKQSDSVAVSLLRRRRHQRGRRERGAGVRGVLRGPGRVLLPEQPVGDFGAGAGAEPHARSSIGLPGSASPASRWMATTCSR